MIVGLTGRAGSGKDSVGAMLRKEYGAALLSFAAPLKTLCRDLFDLTDEQVNTLEGKETPDPRWTSAEGKARTPREILQLIGTEGFRAVDPSFWVKRAMANATTLIRGGAPVVVFTDVRFPNECAAIRDSGGIVLRLAKSDGPGTDQAGHASEAQIDTLDVDAQLTAPHGQLPMLYQGAREFMRAFGVHSLDALR